MKTLQFKCTMLSDVIINQDAASASPNNTLDYIPGSNFLGIAASKLYEDSALSVEQKWEIFHSGKVRFGDAHPSHDGKRGLHVPACFYHPKTGDNKNDLYVMPAIPDPSANEIRDLQLKQHRSGFYLLSATEAQKITTSRNYAIKSAHDKVMRTSKDSEMFGYESLAKGLEMLFEVQVDNEALVECLNAALVGRHGVGRSRSAQYGRVEIEACEFEQFRSGISTGNEVLVYAESRLIFLDEYGLPTLQPSSEQLGLRGGKIDWRRSQVRTFRYAPYNYRRRCFDTDRCGIEKGSVFVVKYSGEVPSSESRLGVYVNEGFGAVIYNPAFLKADAEGKSYLTLVQDDSNKIIEREIAFPNTTLALYLRRECEQEASRKDIYRIVNEWCDRNMTRFLGQGDKFASQWGAIRSIASKGEGLNDICDAVEKYLNHGVAKRRWEKRRRWEVLKTFMEELNDNIAKETIVNLAAEMAKLCRKEENK